MVFTTACRKYFRKPFYILVIVCLHCHINKLSNYTTVIMDISEKVEIIRLFSISQNAHEVRKILYRKKLENGDLKNGIKTPIDQAEIPSAQFIINLNKHFDETGTVLQNLHKRSFEVRLTYGSLERASSTDNVSRIKSNSSSKSLESSQANRKLSPTIVLSSTSINKMLQDKSKTYVARRFQLLNDDDIDRRLEFCETWQKRLLEDPMFHQKIVWSNEAKFHINGSVNTHNCTFVSEENPNNPNEYTANAPGINVWGAVWNEEIVGPVFFETAVTSEEYLELLSKYVYPYIVTQLSAHDLIFQQDGTRPYFTEEVRADLNTHLPKKWIGRRGPIEWPPKSQDLSPMNFFVWGYLKNQVYNKKVYVKKLRNVDDLKIRIQEEFTAIRVNKELIKRVTESVNERVAECINANGDSFEI